MRCSRVVNWYEEVLSRKEELLNDLFSLLRIESVKDEQSKTKENPMGHKVGEALQFVLSLSEKNGFQTKNVDGFAGHAEYGDHDNETIGILCHVDVVPATGEWTSPPFEPTIRDGKIFARGAIDDKGPTLAAFYGLKIVKELGLPLKKNVRVIFGTDEESGMSCMKHYKDVEQMPTVGFAPDAVFPIINAEKGQINVKLTLSEAQGSLEEGQAELQSFSAGSRINMVPERATAIISGKVDSVVTNFEEYCSEQGLKYEMNRNGEEVELTLYGVSAHGMEPHAGLNAGTLLASFLFQYELSPAAHTYLSFLTDLHKDFNGESLQIQFQDEVTGPLTVNPGMISYEKDGEKAVSLNIRVPVTTNYENIKQRLAKMVDGKGFIVSESRESQPHHVGASHPMIDALQKAYQEETGLEPSLLSTGGATYARFMENGVAFGACFPGKVMTAHQKDEYIEVDDLLKATAIYARAIYELAK
jgi:succinyl-diaminopimelate desuccinylase